jgi:hypothetical protein
MTLLLALFILARDNDSDIIKIVVGVIFLALWGLGALISAWNKKAEQERKRRQLGQLPQGLSQYYAKQLQTPHQPQYVAPPPPPPTQRSKKRRKSSIAAPPVPAGPPPAPAPVATVQATTAPASAAPEVARVARLVHRPESLRAAFILNEVLSPPVSLR